MAEQRELLASLLRWTLGSSGALAVVVGVAPWSYDKMAGPSARAQEATDFLAELNPAIDAHRREADLVRSRARRAGSFMLRGGDSDKVGDRLDDLSLVVSDYQTTSVDLEKLTFEILTPEDCQEAIKAKDAAGRTSSKADQPKRETPKEVEAREWLEQCETTLELTHGRALPTALRDVINATEAINDCVQIAINSYRDTSMDRMRNLGVQPVKAGDPDPTALETLLCRKGVATGRLTRRMELLDGCSTAIRYGLIQVRDDIEDVRRENAWSRSWNDLWSWATSIGRKDVAKPRAGQALAALDDDIVERLQNNCGETRLGEVSRDFRGEPLTPWENDLPMVTDEEDVTPAATDAAAATSASPAPEQAAPLGALSLF